MQGATPFCLSTLGYYLIDGHCRFYRCYDIEWILVIKLLQHSVSLLRVKSQKNWRSLKSAAFYLHTDWQDSCIAAKHARNCNEQRQKRGYFSNVVCDMREIERFKEQIVKWLLRQAAYKSTRAVPVLLLLLLLSSLQVK